MSEKIAARTREKWVDDVKVIACILVVLGHFFQSMTKSNILPKNHLYEWFEMTIYYFHVPLFFICSGYLYQKYSKVNSAKSWCRNVKKKALTLGVPYVFFTTTTWILKKAFSSSINDQIGGLRDTLFLHPTAPYWYLYALFFIFFITPTFSNVKMATLGMIVALAAKVLFLIDVDSIYVISTVLSNEIWFVLGMCICAFNVYIKGRKVQGMIAALLFVALSIVVYMMDIQSNTVSFAMGLLACVAVILLITDFEKSFSRGMGFLTKYTMPIFLMHTLFAAPVRAVLLKFGIENVAIHVILGLVISFVGPIIVSWIMEKIKWLEFILYPNRLLQRYI